MEAARQKLALVVGVVPSVHDIDQFKLLAERYDLSVIGPESIIGYLTQTSYFQDLTCVALADYEDNPSYIPGLEKVLSDFDVVVVKERIGLYAYQCLKAKWKYRFRLVVWVDNLSLFPAEDVKQMKVVRLEVTNAADGFIVQTKAAANTLETEGVLPERIANMLPYVEPRNKRTKKSRAKARETIGIAESNFVIGVFGQIEWEEGLDQLVSALKLVTVRNHRLRDNIKVVFCGIGSYAPNIRDLFVDLGIDDMAIYLQPSRQSNEAAMLAIDCMYVNSIPSRDRIDGDPYRILTAMANDVPILGSRSPVVEEMCGKHRIDFCQGSVHSLTSAILKMEKADALVKDVVKKNQNACRNQFSMLLVKKSMEESLEKLTGLPTAISNSNLDHQVAEAEARVNGKQYLAAIDIIENCFKNNDIPVHHKANLYRLIGDCFAKLGDNDASKDAYIQSAELDPYSAKVYIGLGTLSLVKNSFDIAVLHFQKAVSLAPEDEMANLGLGLAFHGMDERKEALRWVNKSLNYNYTNTAAIFTLVKLSHELGEFQDAEKALNKYIDVHPNDYNMIYTLGGIYFKMQRFEETVNLMEKIVEIDPMDTKAHTLLKQANRCLEEAKASSSQG